MKKLICTLIAGAFAAQFSVFAGPPGAKGGAACPGPGPCRPGPCRPGPEPCRPGPHHPGPGPHHPDGVAVAAGVVGGAIVGAAISAATQPKTVVVQQPATTVVVQQPATTVVQQPVTTTQQVWVEGRYVDTVQANGTVIRTWQPGHYETRTITVQ